MKNPDWTKEELVLALDLYFKLEHGQMHGTNPAVIQLSKDLKALGVHSDIANPVAFRSVNSVSLKLANLKRLDKNFSGIGMKGGSNIEKAVWAEYSSNRDLLTREAEVIRRKYLQPKATEGSKELKTEEPASSYSSEFKFLIHRNLDTNPITRRLKINAVRNEGQDLKCTVCNLDFISFYGQIGVDALEIHYAEAIEEPVEQQSIQIGKYAIVCSNCHEILDKHYELITVLNLRKMIRNKK